MSGLVKWVSRAKRKGVKRTTGPVNAHRLRASAAKQRKAMSAASKIAEKARKEATAKAVAEING